MTWELAIQWALTCVLGAAALYLAVLNWYALLKRMTTAKGPTWIPLVGGLLGMAAVLVQPTGIARGFWWVPLILDAGSAPGFAVAGFCLLTKRYRRDEP